MRILNQEDLKHTSQKDLVKKDYLSKRRQIIAIYTDLYLKIRGNLYIFKMRSKCSLT